MGEHEYRSVGNKAQWRGSTPQLMKVARLEPIGTKETLVALAALGKALLVSKNHPPLLVHPAKFRMSWTGK